ncbi:MAG: NAD(P)/FAD-dependent oxidoreductase [Pedosphaera sp.]|nr:NAD(P)/FAD-dependent oxidoreductase [Pedosphaera sp.]
MSESRKTHFDVAIIGGGSGGYASARTSALLGLKTAVIEGGEDVGGLCILRGCMPTKALLYATDVLNLVRHAATWGVQTGQVTFNLAAIMARKDRLIREFADYRHSQLTSGKFAFFRANARFMDAHKLALSDGTVLTADHFIISTGSITATPPVPGLPEAGFITSDDALKMMSLPRSLTILGGGAVAIEFAQFFARLDVKVTLIQRSHQVLRDFDEDVAREIEHVFARDGITLHLGTQLMKVASDGASKVVEFTKNGALVRVTADELFHGLGRSPNTAMLNLDKAGVSTERGRIVTNSHMQTSAPHIYAAGDCTGPHEIVHIAIQQGEIAAHNIAHPASPRSIDYRLLTSVVFTDPQVASVGLTEKEARSREIPYLTANHRFDDHGKSLIMEAREGFVKLLADPASGEIIGGSIVGPMGGELLHEIIAAMNKRTTVHELALMPHYHPTLAEIWTYPAEELASQINTSIA